MSVQVKWKSGMKNWHFFTNISPCFDMVQDTAIVTVQDRDIFTMEDAWELVCEEWCHF